VEAVALLQLPKREPPHEQVHRLPVTERLEPLTVIRGMPRLGDHRVAVVSLDQDAALVVGGEVHRADHPLAPALAHPLLCCAEQGLEDLGVVLRLDEAELAVIPPLELVPAPV